MNFTSEENIFNVQALSTFPVLFDSRVSFCIFEVGTSTDELLPFRYETVKCDKLATFCKNLSITVAAIAFSTKMRHTTWTSLLQKVELWMSRDSEKREYPDLLPLPSPAVREIPQWFNNLQKLAKLWRYGAHIYCL